MSSTGILLVQALSMSWVVDCKFNLRVPKVETAEALNEKTYAQSF